MDEKTRSIINLFHEYDLKEAYINSCRDKYNNLEFDFNRTYDDPTLREYYKGVGLYNKLVYKVYKQVEEIEKDAIFNKKTGNYDKLLCREMIVTYSLIIGYKNSKQYFIAEYKTSDGLNKAYNDTYNMLLNNELKIEKILNNDCIGLFMYDRYEEEIVKTFKKYKGK